MPIFAKVYVNLRYDVLPLLSAARSRCICACQNLPAEARADPEIAAMAGYGCLTRMHVVRLLAPPLAGEDYWAYSDAFCAPLLHFRRCARDYRRLAYAASCAGRGRHGCILA